MDTSNRSSKRTIAGSFTQAVVQSHKAHCADLNANTFKAAIYGGFLEEPAMRMLKRHLAKMPGI